MFFKRHKIIKKFGPIKSPVKLTICDYHSTTLDSFFEQFKEINEVSIVQGDITKFKCDAIITVGNSFGDMGGGVDKAIDDSFGGEAQKIVQSIIAEDFFGELPVGSSFYVFPEEKRPALIYAPSMRIPGQLSNTINPYLALRTALIVAIQNNFEHIVCPALGCGVGGVDPKDAAEQMLTAFAVIAFNRWKDIIHPAQAPYALR
ncbi:MAG: phosphatase [Deltaproteobacteria bacterium]|nr:phosphatase [Deltaproteobacteria bacterium]